MAKDKDTQRGIADALCERGLDVVKSTGCTAMSAAEEIVGQEWEAMSAATKQQLAVLGVSLLINNRVAQERMGSSKDYGLQEEIDRIHKLIECPFGCHQSKPKKRRWCVMGIFGGRDPRTMSKEELNRFIEGQVAENLKLANRMSEAEAMSLDGLMGTIVDVMDSVYQHAVSDLSSIMLLSSEGDMKPLFRFSLKDAALWCKTASARREAWGAREEFFEDMGATLSRATVEEVCNLPVPEIKRLGKLANQIWKDGDSTEGEAA